MDLTLRKSSTLSTEGSSICRNSTCSSESDDDSIYNPTKNVKEVKSTCDSCKIGYHDDMSGKVPDNFLDLEVCQQQASPPHISRIENSSFFQHPESSVSDVEASLSLIAGLERTMFAALNNAWLLVMAGVGLNMVGNNDEGATRSGIAILVSAAICVVIAIVFHFYRISQIKNNRVVSYGQTLLWTGLVGAITFVSLIFEIYFGIMHPYLLREKIVSISAENP